ncbi:LuxR C-terminal-related transcriptional regulator [Haloechinothrix alba]|nr:LuxR C-terminal-related transcriptional regulator [Haloechinothrix alba]
MSELVGTTTDSLYGLTVKSGQGLGGRAIELRRPVTVTDYEVARVITHHFDGPVREEGIRSILAVPVIVRRNVRAVLYGAIRQPVPLGDRTINAVVESARELEQDIAVREEVDRRIAALTEHTTPGNQVPTPDSRDREYVRQAHAELRALVHDLDDANLSTRIDAACDALRANLDNASPSETVQLSRRELDVLSMVAIGKTNAEAGNALGLRLETVKSYMRSVLHKLDCHTRMQAVHTARRIGLLP